MRSGLFHTKLIQPPLWSCFVHGRHGQSRKGPYSERSLIAGSITFSTAAQYVTQQAGGYRSLKGRLQVLEAGFVTAQSTFPLLQGLALYSSLSDARLALCSMMCALLDDVKARGVFKHYSPQRPRSGTWSAPCGRAAVVPKRFTLIPLRADREISGGKAFQDLTVVTVASRCSPTNQ